MTPADSISLNVTTNDLRERSNPLRALFSRASVNRMPVGGGMVQEANTPGKAWGHADVDPACLQGEGVKEFKL